MYSLPEAIYEFSEIVCVDVYVPLKEADIAKEVDTKSTTRDEDNFFIKIALIKN